MDKWEKTGIACPCGTSSDAYALDKQGKGYCFRCSTLFRDNEKAPEEEVDNHLKAITYPHRGLNKTTLQKYGVLTRMLDDVPVETGFFYPGGAVKLRSMVEKKFRTHGGMNKEHLFGKNLFEKGSKSSITITEGEYDALAAFQMLGGKSACVSVRSGSSAYRDVSNEFEYVNSFEKIVLCFDNDEVGKEAAASIAGLFDFEKVYNLELTKWKDANKYLEEGDQVQFVEAWNGCKRYTPDAILSTFDEFKKALTQTQTTKLADYPIVSLQEKLKGIHEQEVIVFKGDEGIGKQLANDTPIPTPTGWTTMGELKVGDEVFDAHGNPTKVTFITPTQYNVPCYRVYFNDGESVVAGGPHRWGVYSQKNSYKIKTTQDMVDAGVLNRNGSAKNSIPVMNAASMKKITLPINPYFLGLWLGDGNSHSANISIGFDDFEQEWKNYDGIKATKQKSCMEVRFSQLTYKQLKENNLLKNKHIPKSYLRAHVNDRQALLSGLMDSDGSSWDGGCEFYTSNELLKDQFLELARSLGYVCRVRQKQPTLEGVNKKVSWTVRFRSDGKIPVFTYSRKQEKVKIKETSRLWKKAIVKIEPVESVPSRCIQVDNDESLYVCGKGWNVTHNTEIFRLLEYHLLRNTSLAVGIIHLEESISEAMQGLVSYHIKAAVNLNDGLITHDEVFEEFKSIVGGDENRIVFHDSYDLEDENTFLDNVRFLVTVCKCKVILFDHISWLATGSDNEDERKKLDRISQRLKTMAKELKFCLIEISHVNDDGKTRGSRNITKVANTVVHLSRDVTAPIASDRNKLYMTIEKARMRGAESGPAGFVEWNAATHNLEDVI